MKQIVIIIALSILCFWLLQDRCTRPAKTAADLRNEMRTDSIIRDAIATSEQAKEREKQVDRQVDSVIKVKDSIASELATIKTKLQSSGERVVTLTRRIDAGKKRSDTVRIVLNCDSLADEVRYYMGQSADFQLLTRDLQVSYDSAVVFFGRQIDSARKDYARLKKSFDAVTQQIDFKNLKISNLSRKNERKFTVGAGIGYGIGLDGKPQPQGGIYVTRQLFKFKL